MQALQKKQLEEQKMREMLATDGTRSIEERAEHCRALQYEEHQGLFAISHSSIHKAAADGSIDGLKYFLHSHRKPKVRIDDFDKNGFCPIHSAAIKGSNHSIRFLVDQGCNPDTRTTYGDTALMHACKENKLETIELLFNLGAQVTLSNKAGFTALHMAAQADNMEAIKLLVELTCQKQQKEKLEVQTRQQDGDEISLTSATVATLNTEADSLFMQSLAIVDPAQNAEVSDFLNQASRNLTTPLHIACLNNSLHVIELLLSLHVRLGAQDSSGDTALHKAGRLQLNDAYQMLLRAGASPSIRNNFSETPRDLLIDNPAY